MYSNQVSHTHTHAHTHTLGCQTQSINSRGTSDGRPEKHCIYFALFEKVGSKTNISGGEESDMNAET